MKLVNATLRPGVVRAVEKNGNIKASAPGLFSHEDDPSLLPPIFPFPIGNTNTFTQPKELDEVWVLQNTDNPLELFWIRKDDYDTNNSELNLQDETNVDIICNRDSGMGWASIYFSDGTGWVIKNDSSKIQISKTGDIILETGASKHQRMSIGSDGIILGTGEQPAVLGKNLQDVLYEIISELNKIKMAAMTNPFTSNIGTALADLPATKLTQSISTIVSSNVKID